MFTKLCSVQVGRGYITAEQMAARSLLNKQVYCSTVKFIIFCGIVVKYVHVI